MKQRALTRLAPQLAVLGALTFAVSCGGDDPPNNPPATGVRIDSFTATPTAVSAGGKVTLSWRVSGASSAMIAISAEPGGAIHSATTLEGTFETEALTATTRFKLTATGGGRSVDREVTVTVEGAGIQIASFTASPNPAPVNGTVTLSWVVAGATRITIHEGQSELHTTTENVATGSHTVTLTAASHTYRLRAENGGASTEQSVTVTTAVAGDPEIRSFQVTPRTFSGASAQVTVSWDTVGTPVALTANGTAVPNFPGSSSGTLAVTVTDRTAFVLRVGSGAQERTAEVVVARGTGEQEPNNDANTANDLAAGGVVVGAVDPAMDVDFFRVTVPAGGNIFAETSDGMGGCPFDTILRLYAADGTTLLGSNDDAGGTLCSRIDPRVARYAADLAAGTYYVAVSGFQDSTGTYSLEVRVGVGECGNGIIEPSRNEECDDGNMTPNDGCSATCEIELAGTINPPGGTVNVTLGDTEALPRFVEVVITTPGQSIAATLSDGNNGCPVPSAMGLFSRDFQTMYGAVSGEGECAYLDPVIDPFVANLAPGTYALGMATEVGNGGALVLDVQIINPACGNQIRESRAGEQCDDGNMMSGDGCSATCQYEGIQVEVEPNDTRPQANALAPNPTRGGAAVTVAADISPAGDVDYFSFTIPAGQTATLQAITYSLLGDPTSCGEAKDTVLTLLDAQGTELAENDDDPARDGYCSALDGAGADAGAANLGPGTYYLRVEPYFSDDVYEEYFLQVRLIP